MTIYDHNPRHLPPDYDWDDPTVDIARCNVCGYIRPTHKAGSQQLCRGCTEDLCCPTPTP